MGGPIRTFGGGMALTTVIDWVKLRVFIIRLLVRRRWLLMKRRWTRSGGGMTLLSRVGVLLIFVGLAAGIAVWRAATLRTAALTTWPWVLNHHEALRNLGLLAAGAIALPLAYYRTRVAARQAETARRSLLNERDQKAAEMVGSPLLSVRLGGIYALQTLAAEHPSHYHLGVMRQFCAFVRGPRSPPRGTAPRPIPTAPDSGARPDTQDNLARLGAAGGDAAPAEPVREDVRAIMDAIAARSDAGIAVEQKEGFTLDLIGANLREWGFSGATSGANLSEADLSGANLSKADLFEADLSWANLSGANLSGANLNADLSAADLSGANLSKAHLFEANLFEANLSGANLSEANLSEANLHGCNVSSAIFSAGTVITQEQLDKTRAGPLEKPPIFVGDVRDAETKALLNWRPR